MARALWKIGQAGERGDGHRFLRVRRRVGVQRGFPLRAAPILGEKPTLESSDGVIYGVLFEACELRSKTVLLILKQLAPSPRNLTEGYDSQFGSTKTGGSGCVFPGGQETNFAP